jgi:hypothetical protein
MIRKVQWFSEKIMRNTLEGLDAGVSAPAPEMIVKEEL